MKKNTRTIIVYSLAIFLQILCFHLGSNSLKLYNDSSRFKYWMKIFRPSKPEIVPSSEWFSLDNWSAFKVIYYDSKELVMFIILFTITFLCYLAFTTKVVKNDYKYLRPISLILSLLSGYIVLYEIIAIVNECIILC